jgi:elongation factor 3
VRRGTLDIDLRKTNMAEAAAKKLLDDMLGSDEPMLVRAFKTTLDQENAFVRDVTFKAATAMIAAALKGGKGEDLFVKIEKMLDGNKDNETVVTALIKISGEIAGNLERASLKRMLVRCGQLFDADSDSVRAAASIGITTALKAGISKGTIEAGAEPTVLLTSSLTTMASADSSAKARTAACGIGAAVGALGVKALAEHNVLKLVDEAMESKKKEAPSAREAGYLAVGVLCHTLKAEFEPYGIPLLLRMVKTITDKDKKVADAATLGMRSLIEGLSGVSVKTVMPALYEGMQVVGGGGRSKVECLQLAATLAKNARRTMGPCLAECIPHVLECLNDSNAKVQSAAEEALPVLCSCTDNAEVGSTLKGIIMEALKKPDTTFACIEEVLMTTFCNPMDGTSLAFMMPIIIRGIKDPNYLLVKKATTCASNLCALIKDSSDIMPFFPLLMPLLEKNLDHSSPDIRDASVKAKEKLEEGAGDSNDPDARRKIITEMLSAEVKGLSAAIPAEVSTYLAETGSALLEETCGGVVRVQFFKDAVGQLAEWLGAILKGYVDLPAGSLAAVAEAAVEKFKEELSSDAKRILYDSGDKDFSLDIQNIILAFAGRVLLRKADVRFERGNRYGLIGQNGTGKTTLLNRLAAKDITGFPQHLRTHYIRHELICDDGIDVKQYLDMKAPEWLDDEKEKKAKIEEVLDRVEFPQSERSSFCNSLSAGWKMRLMVANSVLHDPELLLLDEPTNHMDPSAVEWLKNHLLSLEGVTMAIVSHDYNFIDDVCTDVTHYDNGGQLGKPCRFVYYPMTFSQFQKLKPEVAAGLPQMDHGAPSTTGDAASELAEGMSGLDVSDKTSDSGKSKTSDSGKSGASSEMSATLAKVEEMIAAGLILPMNFPDPGKPDGIRTFRKPILTLKDINFKYPETDKYILQKVEVTLTLGSRSVIVGGNGSGKSTALKLLVGDLEAEQGVGEVWKHHNLRLSYVAQQSLHHLEDFLLVTPVTYIQERFRTGLDKEIAKLKTQAISPEDEKDMEAAGAVYEIVGRAQKGKQLWYECKKRGRVAADVVQIPLSELEMMKPYVKKLIKNFDQKQQAIDSGMAVRPITAAEILQHLADFGIDSQLANGKIRQMSGGQRQRLVICAAFWSKPHVIALDEPTNYLDNDSVAALTKGLKDFKGAVVCVSENEAFVAEIANEKWVVENGQVTIVQLRDAKAR